MSTFLNRFSWDVDTRLITVESLSADPVYHDGLVYDVVDNSLLVDYSGTPAFYMAGIGFTTAGAMCVFDASAGLPADVRWQSGLPIKEAESRLCVDPTNAVLYYHQGVTFTTVGAVAVTGGAPPGPCDTPTTILSLPADITVSGTGSPTQLELAEKSYQPFSFSTGGIVTDLHWTGGTSPGPEPFDITAWLIEFWNDNAGVPGTLNQTAVFSPALANKTAIGLIQGASLHGYTFSVDILPWFLADPGVTYWVSLQPSLQLPEQYFWISSTTPGNSFLDFNGTPVPNSFALSLDITGCDGTITVNTRITGNGDTRITGNGDTRIIG